jgi:outer membrane immunogenic protein
LLELAEYGGEVVNRLLILGIAALSAIAALESALAADMQVAPRRTAPAQQTANSNWSGGQVGGSNGVSSVNNGFVEPGAYLCPAIYPLGVSCFETPFSFSDHKLSYTVGPFLGYRWQFGMAVVGVEADWSWKKGESSSLVSLPFVCFNPACTDYRTDTKSGSVSQTWDSSFRGRLGWLVTPSTLLYGTAGLAVGQIKGTFTYSATAFTVGIPGSTATGIPGSTATALGSWSDTRLGGTAGAGVETEVLPRWKLRFEYRYTDYGTYTKSVPVSTICVTSTGCSVPSSLATINLRESFHTFRVGLGYDF